MKFIFSILIIFLNLFALGQVDSSDYKDLPLEFPIVIHYQNNSAEISHVNRFRLIVLSEYLRENPKVHILIEGHVCCGPDLRVSKRRAKTVYKNLLKQGVPREQMKFVGKSFDEPIIKREKSESDKDRNRRVEITIVK